MIVIINALILILYTYSLSTKILRWLSIWQQKEYRYDRLFAYLKTSEGLRELKKIFVFPIKKTAIRRPRMTPKAIIVLISTVLLMLIYYRADNFYLAQLYLLAPLYVVLGSIPAQLATLGYIYYLETKAKEKLKKVHPEIIGVGGSYGKTTTKILIGTLLKQNFSVWVSPKSHNTPLSIASALAKNYNNQEIIVMEYASYKKGEINYLTKRYPVDSAVFTGLNEQHLAIFGGWDKMVQAETELYENLKPGARLFFNSSDNHVREQVSTYSEQKLIDSESVKFNKVGLDQNGYLQFEIEENLLVRTKLLGAHYLPNLKQAVNVAREYNISNKLIAQALANFEPGEEFIQRKTTSDGVTLLIDDRTANPDGFRAGLELLQFIEGEKKYVISSGIVDLADKTDEVHIKIGHLAKLIGATFIHTSTTGSAALKDALSENYVTLTNVEAVSKYFEHNLKSSDVVLIEGKLHPTIASYIQEL